MQATGIRDLDQLVKTFIQAEEKNFALFKFVNELNLEIENYETQIFEMQSEIDRNLAEGGHDSQKRRVIKDLEGKLNRTNESISEMESEQKKNLEKIKKIKECISKISKVVECDETLNQDLLGHQGITESNMFVYMGMVEQRINELLQAYAYIQGKKNQPLYSAQGFDTRMKADKDDQKVMDEIRKQQEQIMMPGIFQHMGKMGGVGSIEPPSFEEDDDDEEEDFAQSRKDMKQRRGSRSSSQSKPKQEMVVASDDDDDDDIDLFSVPMNSEAFMAKIKEQ